MVQQTAAAVLADFHGIADVVRQDFAAHFPAAAISSILNGGETTKEQVVTLETLADVTKTLHALRTGYGQTEVAKSNIGAATEHYQAAMRAATGEVVLKRFVDLHRDEYDDDYDENAQVGHCEEGVLHFLESILESQKVEHTARTESTERVGETAALTAKDDEVLENGFTLFGYQQQLLATTLPPMHCPSPDRVPATIDPAELFEKYIHRNIPFIVEAGTYAVWPANSKWTRAGLIEHYADVELNVAPKPLPTMPDAFDIEYAMDPEVKQMNVESFLHTVMANADGDGNSTHPELRYVFNTMNMLGDDIEHSFGLFPNWEEMSYDDAEPDQPPPFFDNTPHIADYFEFAIGPALTGAHMHSHGAAWNAIFSGKKRWAISPMEFQDEHGKSWDDEPAYHWFRDELPKLLRSGANSGTTCKVLEFEQRPGELVFIPDQYYHAVLNLEPTVAAAKQLGHSMSRCS
jgi:hypothetical protein